MRVTLSNVQLLVSLPSGAVSLLSFDPQTRRWVTSSAGWGCLPIVRSMISRPIGDGSVKVTIMRLRREVQTILERGGDGSDGSGADTTVIGR